MPDLTAVPGKWWRMMLLVSVGAAMLSLIICLLLPKKYLSVATAFPANSISTDKARYFNDNIQILYSLYGDEEELDKLEGTAKLDTIYSATVKELSLAAHYDYSNSVEGIQKAIERLKDNTTLDKTAYGQFRVKSWDHDKDMAAGIANTLMNQVNILHSRLQQQANLFQIQQLKMAAATLEQQLMHKDSTEQSDTVSIGKAGKAQRLLQYQKLIDEYQMMAAASQPVLLIAEHAKPAVWSDSPRILPAVLVSFFGTFLFAFLSTVYFINRKSYRG